MSREPIGRSAVVIIKAACRLTVFICLVSAVPGGECML